MSRAAARQDAIRRLLAAEEFRSQEELRRRLAREGFPVSQPVLSRDLRALPAAKRDGVYVLLESDRVTPLAAIHALLRDVAPAGPHLVVIRCEPGAASAIARALEAEEPPGLVGTVAGDDTILAAVSGRAAGRRLVQRVRDLL